MYSKARWWQERDGQSLVSKTKAWSKCISKCGKGHCSPSSSSRFFFFFFKYPLEFKEWGAVSRGYQWKAVRNVHKGSSSEKNSQTSLWSHRWAAHKEEGVLIFAAGQPNLRYEKDCLSLPRLCHEIWIPAANATSSFKNKYGCTHNVYKIKWIFKHAEMGWMKKIIRHYCQKVYILQKIYICIYIKNYILQNYYYYFFNILAYGCQT